MEFKGIRVLILEGYARQSISMIHALHKLGCHVSVLCSSKLDISYTSRFTDEKIIGICDRENVRGTTEQIRRLIMSGKYDVVIPMVDFSASILSDNKAEFSKYVKVASNDKEVYDIASDKISTMEICMEKNIPCPKTLLNIKSIEDIKNCNLKFPLIIKPRVGYGAIGFKKVNFFEELQEIFKSSNEDIRNYVIQEFIPQTGLQYECAMFIDNNNEVKTSVVFSKNRWFPVEGGSSTLNITVDRKDIIENCAKLLKSINWRGPADIDLIQDERDGTAKIMEINPRISGSVKIVFEAGVDQAKQIIELLYNQSVTKFEEYKKGIRLRCSQTDFLWFIKSKDRFKAKPSWFSIINQKDQIFYLNDMLPWFAFTIQKIIHLKEEMKKRSR